MNKFTVFGLFIAGVSAGLGLYYVLAEWLTAKLGSPLAGAVLAMVVIGLGVAALGCVL